MTRDTRSERVVTIAARFPDNNAGNPVDPFVLAFKLGDELADLSDRDRYDFVMEVAKLINDRPADPFAGL